MVTTVGDYDQGYQDGLQETEVLVKEAQEQLEQAKAIIAKLFDNLMLEGSKRMSGKDRIELEVLEIVVGNQDQFAITIKPTAKPGLAYKELRAALEEGKIKITLVIDKVKD